MPGGHPALVASLEGAHDKAARVSDMKSDLVQLIFEAREKRRGMGEDLFG
jgi:hypothetical protein